MGVADSNGTARNWSRRGGLRRNPTDESDAFVKGWKECWLAGADAYWAAKSSINPKSDDPARAAWQAGWDWAKDHPDRRNKHHLRLAHPHRRATDPARRVPRAVKIGAFGVGLLAASRWVWRAVRPIRTPDGT
jgi:hypothetical protein